MTKQIPYQDRKRIVKDLLALLRPVRWIVAGAVLLSAATVLANVGLLSVSAVLISLAALQPALLDLMVFIVGVRFFGISRAVLRYTERYVSHKITFDLLTALRVRIYQKMEPAAPRGLQKFSHGQLFDRLLNDIEVLKFFYLRAVLAPLSALVVLLVSGFFLSRFHVPAALLLLLMFLLFGLGIPVLMKTFSREKAAERIAQREQWQILLEDYLGGLGELQHTGKQKEYLERMEAQLREQEETERWLHRMENLTTGLIGYGSNLSLILALLVIVPAVGSGDLNGVYTAMILLMIWSSFEALNPLPQALIQLQESIEAAGHFDLIPEIKEKERMVQKPESLEIAFSGISFSYEKGRPVYTDFSLSVPSGAKIALAGTSGSGKSTLASLLVGFFEPEQGEISIGGIPLDAYPPAQIRDLVGIVEQETFLFSATLAENLRLAKKDATEEELKEAIRFAGLKDVVEALPDGLETNIGDNGYRLSGGERQRVALARIRLRDCPILILDELFQGMDGITASFVRNELNQWGKEKTMIYITHSLQNLGNLDRIYLMDHGKILEEGRAEELLARKESRFYRMWQIEREQIAGLF